MRFEVIHMATASQTHKPLIALFSQNLEGGGAERDLVNLARSFCERGFPVDVVLTSASGVLFSELPSAVRVVDLQSTRMVLSLPALCKYLFRQRPHSLLAFSDHSNIVAIWAGRITGRRTKIVIGVHQTWPMAADNPRDNWKMRLLPWFARRAYKHADAIVAVSNGAADSLTRTLGIERGRISVIYNPVITPEFLKRSSEPLAHPWFNAGEVPVVVGIGSLNPRKDFPTLLRAFAKVRSFMRCRLMIMGEGARREELEHLADELGIRQDVLLPGFIANPFPNLKRAGVFVLSSSREGLGNVLIEALALGVPCVATNCESGPSEILAGGRYGLLTPVGDVDSMAAAIAAALKRTRTAVPETAMQPFTLATVTDAYERILA